MPLFIAWGGRDDERMERTGRQMIDALTTTRCGVQSLVLPECDHFSIHLNTRQLRPPFARQLLDQPMILIGTSQSSQRSLRSDLPQAF